MKKLLAITLLILFSVSVAKGLHYFKDGFSPRRIHPLATKIDAELDPETKKALDQPFYYLGRGRQCFAFSSQDGKYVLKIPRTDIFTLPFWSKVLPLKSIRERIQKAQLKKREFVFNSFQIASEELKEQTGVITLHLGTSKPEKKSLVVVDCLNCTHHLPLSTTPFILQYKYSILIKDFQTALKEARKEDAKKILASLADVIIERGKKGISNGDPSFMRNYGFDGEKAYQIDLGTFYRMPEVVENKAFQKSVRDTMWPIQEWLKTKDPEMFRFLTDTFEAKVQ